VRFNSRALRERAEAFGRDAFEARLKAFLDKALAEHGSPS
jgi:hypothetical protein